MIDVYFHYLHPTSENCKNYREKEKEQDYHILSPLKYQNNVMLPLNKFSMLTLK